MTELIRATRRDHPGIESLLRGSDWGAVDLDDGEALIARDGGEVVGLVRLADVDSDGVFVDDVVVAGARRGAGLGSRMMRAAMVERTGPFFLVCHDDRIAFYERLGFSRIEESELPERIREHAYRTEQLPSHPGHVHRLMRR